MPQTSSMLSVEFGVDMPAFSKPTAVRTYLDTANVGLPPIRTRESVQRAVDDWAAGACDWSRTWDPLAERARDLYARMAKVERTQVALVPAVSVAMGVIAGAIPPGSTVLLPDDEFTSVLLPVLAQAGPRGLIVRTCRSGELAERVADGVDWVIFSHVKSNGGAKVSMRELREACDLNGTRMVVDVTHSAGVLDIDAGLADYTMCAGYKHLLCPRGVAFMTMTPRHGDRPLPTYASWRSLEDCYGNYYGNSLADLARDARAYDVSLTWFSWVGAVESLALLASWPTRALHEHAVGLATRTANHLGLKPTGSSILGVPIEPRHQAIVRDRLGDAGVRVSERGGSLRVSFHAYNDVSQVDELVSHVTDAVIPAL